MAGQAGRDVHLLPLPRLFSLVGERGRHSDCFAYKMVLCDVCCRIPALERRWQAE